MNKLTKRVKAGWGVAFAAVAMMIGGVDSAAAQEDQSRALIEGRRSVTFAIPEGGGGTFGIWRMTSDRMNRGLLINANVSYADASVGESSADGWNLALAAGPAFRRYFGALTPVAPFIQTTFMLGAAYQSTSFQNDLVDDSASRWQTFGDAGVGIGAEWFPHRMVGVNGYTGVRGGLAYASHDDADVWSVSASTFTSALTLQIYF